MLGLILTTTN